MDILHYLQQELFSFSFEALLNWTLIFFAGFLFVALQKYGAFSKLILKDTILQGCTILYINVEGKDEEIHKAFAEMNECKSKFFSISKNIGIYYASPIQAAQQKRCRATIGFIVNVGQKRKIEDFRAENPNYKLATLPKSTRIFSINYPYFNTFSFTLICQRVYPKLLKHLEESNVERDSIYIEIYHFLSESNKIIQVATPLENFDAINLWSVDKQ